MGDTLEGDTGGGALSNNTSGICMYVRVCKVVEERKEITYGGLCELVVVTCIPGFSVEIYFQMVHSTKRQV